MSGFGTVGHRSYPERFSPLKLAVALCRHIESGRTLAGDMKKVPDEYVAGGEVSCPCGEITKPDEYWTFCPCGRAYTAGDDGIWAVRLEMEDIDA